MRLQFPKRLLLILILPVALLHVVGQEKEGLFNDLIVEAKYHYGFVTPHHSSIHFLLRENIQGFELTLSSDSYGRHIWEKLYRYPRYGVGYMVNSFGNDDWLGHAHAIFGFYDIPLTNNEKKFYLSYQIGFGMAYLTKVFDLQENPMNIAISSHLNVYGGFDLSAQYRFNDKHLVKAGIDLTHFSNGKMKSPNLGLNIATANISYLYRLLPPKYRRKEPEIPEGKNKNLFEVIGNVGMKEDDQLSGEKHLISTLVFDYRREFSLKYQYGAGIDLFYDQSLGPTKEHELDEPYTSADLYQVGIHGTLSARYNRLNIILQLGSYIHANYYKYTSIFSRVGARYLVMDHLVLNLSLKAHYAIADYIEWGIGYRF